MRHVSPTLLRSDPNPGQQFEYSHDERLIRMVARTSVGPQQRIDFTYDWQGRLYCLADNGPVNSIDPLGKNSLQYQDPASADQPDVPGECGGFDVSKIRWYLSEAAGDSGGYIVQKVSMSWDIKTCAENPISPTYGRYYPFWEAWKVDPGKTLTIYAFEGKHPFDDHLRSPRSITRRALLR